MNRTNQVTYTSVLIKGFNALYSIFLVKILTQKLGLGDYGYYLLVTGVLSTIASLDFGLFKLSINVGSKSDKNETNAGQQALVILYLPIFISMVLAIIGMTIFCLSDILNFEWSKNISLGTYLSLFVVAGALLFKTSTERFLEGRGDYHVITRFIVLQALIDSSVLAFIYFDDISVLKAINIFLIKYVISSLLFIVLSYSIIGKILLVKVSRKDFEIVRKDILSTTQISLVAIASQRLDRYIMAYFFGLETTAVFAISKQIYDGIKSLASIGSKYYLADILRSKLNGKLYSLVRRRIIYFLLVYFLLLVNLEHISAFFSIAESKELLEYSFLWCCLGLAWSFSNAKLYQLTFNGDFRSQLRLEYVVVPINLFFSCSLAALGYHVAPIIGSLVQLCIVSLYFIRLDIRNK